MPSRRQLANAIRALSMDAVEKASSGHPGMPMGMADIAEVLWNDFLRHNPNNPHWINRDRFIISNGHGSMLLYSLLYLTGYQSITLDEIKNFRQLHSKTAGHPESELVEGIETTTGPLGQGLANAVAMALAERILATQFNRPGHEIINHRTYVFLGDGCVMEGISHEACSMAGHFKLGKLIAFYDDNGISIDGHVAGWFTDDTPKRFEAYDWHVIRNVDGHDSQALLRAIQEAIHVRNQPTLIQCKTVIGFGAPNTSGSAKAHGSALGEKEVALVREKLNWHYPPFLLPNDIIEAWDAREQGKILEQQWQKSWQAYQESYPELARELMRRINKELPEEWPEVVLHFIRKQQQDMANIATRKASELCLNAYGPILPELLGGSADLTGSNNTRFEGSKTLTYDNYDGNYIYYGVREFGMCAMMNGLALYGGFIPYGGTFLVFSDYARNAIRLSALMKQQVIYVLTHDSIGLGEDGPTHQPIEHLNMLRNTPQLSLWRPCDAVETAVAWAFAIEHHSGPTCLALTRQNVPAMKRQETQLDLIQKGGYILRDCEGEPEIILIATGSEVHLAIGAFEKVPHKKIRVVSMPSTDIFLSQNLEYQNQVLPPHIRNRIAIEAGATSFWYRFVGLDGKVIGIDRFGESAPAKDVFEYFGFTVEHVCKVIDEFD